MPPKSKEVCLVRLDKVARQIDTFTKSLRGQLWVTSEREQVGWESDRPFSGRRHPVGGPMRGEEALPSLRTQVSISLSIIPA